MTTEDPTGQSKTVRRKNTRSVKNTPRKALLRAALILGAVVLLVFAAGLWLGSRGVVIKDNLEAANASLPGLEEQVRAGNSPNAAAMASRLQENTTAAKEAATDPVWKAAGMLPWIGVNFSAATSAAVSVDDIVSRAAVPLLSDPELLDFKALAPVDGAVNVRWLQQGAPKLISAANVVRLSHERMAGINTAALLPQLAGPLTAATEKLDGLNQSLQAASRTAQVLPAMLGADGSRNYLLMVQNSAETRATGGIPGAVSVISTNDGKMELTGHGSAADIGVFNPPVAVDPEQEQIYSKRLGGYLQDVNLTPDFPTAAATAKTMWEQRNAGTTIDGVIALDPVVLAELLKVTGPVTIPMDPRAAPFIGDLPTQLTSDNAVQTLLSDVYREIKQPALQDAYFAAVAGEVFNALTTGQADGTDLIQALTASAQEHRLYVWSAHSNEQQTIGGSELSGSISGPSVGGAAFGAYFNDGTGAKMDYYVRRTAQLVKKCDAASGYSSFLVRITQTNTAPADAATTLPAYVTGGGVFGVAPGSVQTNIIAYGPAQAIVNRAFREGERSPFGAFEHDGRPVGTVTTVLAPGESSTVEIEFSNVVQQSEPTLYATPGIQSSRDVLLPLETESSCTNGV